MIEGLFIVYCSKCGTQNPDNAKICSNCGAPIYTVGQQYPGSEREHYRRVEGECFGLPYGGLIVTVVVGILIILVGIGLYLQASGYTVSFWPVIWPIIIIIFGVLILLGALYRRQRYAETRR